MAPENVGRCSTQGEDAIPDWVMGCVLHGEFPIKGQPKVSFFLAPWLPAEEDRHRYSAHVQMPVFKVGDLRFLFGGFWMLVFRFIYFGLASFGSVSFGWVLLLFDFGLVGRFGLAWFCSVWLVSLVSFDLVWFGLV